MEWWSYGRGVVGILKVKFVLSVGEIESVVSMILV